LTSEGHFWRENNDEKSEDDDHSDGEEKEGSYQEGIHSPFHYELISEKEVRGEDTGGKSRRSTYTSSVNSTGGDSRQDSNQGKLSPRGKHVNT
jgi:hypothetical protein